MSEPIVKQINDELIPIIGTQSLDDHSETVKEMSKKSDVFSDNTVNQNSDSDNSRTGPLSPGGHDISSGRSRAHPGFSGAPGEGPNPSQAADEKEPMPPPPLKPK